MDTAEKINYRGHIATLVDKIPSGFVVWNTMINGEYVPFCKQGSCKRAYDLSDLRVIKMEKGEVKIINELAIRGFGTMEDLIKYKRKSSLINKGIEILKKYS